MARFARPSYKTVDVFAAACASQRVNGKYIKFTNVNDEAGTTRLANKVLILQFLDGSLDVRNEDRELSENVMQFCQALTFKLLSGRRLSDFEQNMLRIVEADMIYSAFDIAVVSSLPAAYLRVESRKAIDTRINSAIGFVGNISEKVKFSAVIARCNYSEQWNTFFLTALTDDDKAIFFAHRNKIDVGTNISGEGKVKAHRNQYEDSTQLNYVKVFPA